jgi:hypothetical protein
MLLLATLMFIWPIPGTVAVRALLMAVCLIGFGYLAFRSTPWPPLSQLKAPIAFYVLLSAWIPLQALFISHETAWALGEFRGQWLMGFASLAIGALAALTVSASFSHRTILLAISAALFAHVVYADGMALHAFIETGTMPKRVGGLAGTISEGMDKMNYLTNMLFAVLATDAFCRITFRKPLLLVNAAILMVAVGLSVFSTYIEAVRNGFVALLLLLASLGGLYWYENRARISRTLLVGTLAILVAASAAFGYSGYKADTRWQTLIQTVPIALDTTDNKAWLDSQKYPYPKLPNGETVSPSNYERVAWAKEALLLVMQHPLGIGYGRSAFGHGIVAKYGEGRIGNHSHSGILDLAIGTGIPGAVLWLAFLFSLIFASARTYFRDKNPFALTLFFILTGFTTRMLVDSVIRDHMLQQFLFLVGFLAFATFGGHRADRARGAQ